MTVLSRRRTSALGRKQTLGLRPRPPKRFLHWRLGSDSHRHILKSYERILSSQKSHHSPWPLRRRSCPSYKTPPCEAPMSLRFITALVLSFAFPTLGAVQPAVQRRDHLDRFIQY